MPNHVANRLIFEKTDEKTIRRIKEEVMVIPDGKETETDGIDTIDFERIIPTPKEFYIEEPALIFPRYCIQSYLLAACPYTIDVGVEKLTPGTFEKLYGKAKYMYISIGIQREAVKTAFEQIGKERDEIVRCGELVCRNYLKFGYFTLYEWRLDNWNTKRNAYEFWKGEPNGLLFNTANDPPHPIVEALSKRYPAVIMRHEWADEDYGNNCGRRVWLNGAVIDRYDPKAFSKRAIAFARKVWGDDIE